MPSREPSFLETQPIPVRPQDRPIPQDAPAVLAVPAAAPYWTRARLLGAGAAAAALLAGGAALGTTLAQNAQANGPATQQVGLFDHKLTDNSKGDADDDSDARNGGGGFHH